MSPSKSIEPRVSLILGALLYYTGLSIPLALGMLIVSTLDNVSDRLE